MASSLRVRYIKAVRQHAHLEQLKIANDPVRSPTCQSILRQMRRYAPYTVHYESPLRQVVNTSDVDDAYWTRSPEFPPDVSVEDQNEPEKYMKGLWGDDLTASDEPDCPLPDWHDELSIDPQLQSPKNQDVKSASPEVNNSTSPSPIITCYNADNSPKHGSFSIHAVSLSPMVHSKSTSLHHEVTSTVAQAADTDRVPDINLAEESDLSRKRRRYDITDDDEEEGSEFVAYMHAS